MICSKKKLVSRKYEPKGLVAVKRFTNSRVQEQHVGEKLNAHNSLPEICHLHVSRRFILQQHMKRFIIAVFLVRKIYIRFQKFEELAGCKEMDHTN